MPGQTDTTQLYNDLDEVLNKPSKGMARYGYALLLLVIIMVCCIAFVVKHEDTIACRANIQLERFTAVQTPGIKTIIKKFFLRGDTLLRTGDTILIVTPAPGATADTLLPGYIKASQEFVFLAPYSCKATVKRILDAGETVAALTPVADITSAQNKYNVKLEIPEAAAAKVKLGMKVKINPAEMSGNVDSEPVCRIISVPYIDPATKKIVADARLEFIPQKGQEEKPHYIFSKNITATIVAGKKSLAGAFTEN